MMDERDAEAALLCRAGSVLCALPIPYVVETMRPGPVEALPSMPEFVAGMAVVRGAPLPVVKLGRLFGGEDTRPERLVVVRVGERRVGLAVDEVVGVRELPADTIQRLPPLLRDAQRAAVADIGTLDGQLMVVLQAARLVPAEILFRLETEAMPS